MCQLNCQIRSQNGAALVVGLVVLLVMTMVGISSMGSMRTELKIATNIQTHQLAFQAAATGIEAVIQDNAIEWNDTAGGVGTAIATQPAAYTSADGTQTAQMNILFSGCRKVFMGSSLTEGSMAALSHEIVVTGQAMDSTGTDVTGTSKQVLGIQSVMVAGC